MRLRFFSGSSLIRPIIGFVNFRQAHVSCVAGRLFLFHTDDFTKIINKTWPLVVHLWGLRQSTYCRYLTPCVQIFMHLACKHLHVHQLLSDISLPLLWMPFELVLDILYVPHFAAALANLMLKYALISPVFAIICIAIIFTIL